jgi:hypothetical protein
VRSAAEVVPLHISGAPAQYAFFDLSLRRTHAEPAVAYSRSKGLSEVSIASRIFWTS